MRSKILISAGALLLAAALFLTCRNLYAEYQAGRHVAEVAEQYAEAQQSILDVQQEALPSENSTEQPEEETPFVPDPDREMPVIEVDGNSYIGMLEIPEQELSLPVMADWSYPKMQNGPCRYAGSAYRDHFIIMAHNYIKHFGRLTNLQVGSQILFTDAEGHLFVYEVRELGVMDANAAEEMESGGWNLTLFTCTLSGEQRFYVRCMLAENSDN